VSGDDHHDGFDEDESLMLRNFFRDEAHDYLEGITRRLLHASNTELDKAAVAELMRTTHTLKGSAATVGLDVVARCAHRLEDCFVQFRTERAAWSADVADRLVEIVDTLRAVVDAVEDRGRMLALADKMIAQLETLTESRTEAAEPAAAHAPEPEPAAPSDEPAAPSDDGDEVKSGRIPMVVAEPDRRRDDAKQVLRIDPERVDGLMNSVGELVFDRTRIERRMADLRRMVRELTNTRQRLRDELEPARAADPDLARRMTDIEADLAQHLAHLARSTAALVDDAEALRQTTQSLQDGLTEVRMASVHVLFQRLARSLREIARESGKRVELVTSGDDTEFDKLVADQVFDPLLQILRNAVAHGIEDEDEREVIGKPPAGQIRIDARQEGESVWIEVTDDGMGIDPGALRQRFVERGLWTRDRAATATDTELLRAIFEPGVSTRDTTDSLAGRGVGLDAVRETIARIGGDIHVESVRGQGSKFTLRLPITTAISQALLFKVHGHVYAIPNVHVVETSFIEASSPVMPKHLRRKDEIVPLVVLQSVLGARSSSRAWARC